MGLEVQINNNIIHWAIIRAGYDVDAFMLSNPKVKDWVEDKKKPTLSQLEDFSVRVHLPFGYLLLDQPPKEEISIPYFRSSKKESREISLEVKDTIKLIKNRQEWLSDYLKENNYEAINFVGKFKGSTQIQDIVADIRNTLNLTENWAQSFRTWEETLEGFADLIEEKGINVVFNGIVGSNTHRPIPVTECRGFILSDPYAPFMFINGADNKSAQIFTMAHELAHVWIGESAGFDFRRMQPADDPKEILCDKVAAELLVPAVLFRATWEKYQDFKKLSGIFKVSQIVIARRALDLGMITKDQFFEFYNDYINQDFRKRDDKESGGNFYFTQRKRLGIRFSRIINQAIRENRLLYRDAYSLTGMNGNTYHKFMNKFFNK
jgi:Zn-dependent peptidase ImmA (M78 family)